MRSRGSVGPKALIAPLPAARRVLHLVTLAAFALLAVASCRGDAGAPPAALSGPRVVVAPFENRTGDAALDTVGPAAASWIARGLELGGAAVVPYSSVIAAETPAATGASIVVTGGYRRDSDQLVFDARVEDVEGGTAADAESASGPGAEPMDAIDRLRANVASALATIADDSAADRFRAEAMRRREPPVFARHADYIGGIEAYLAQDYATAAERLARPARPGFAAPLVWAALARHALGDYAVADTFVLRALEMPESLTPVERHGAEYVAARLRGDNAVALDAARAASSLAPGSIWTYHAAVASLGANRPAETKRLLLSLDAERGALRGWLPYWSLLTEAHHLLGEHEEELAVARRARGIDPNDLGLMQLEVRALAALGTSAAVDSLLGHASSMKTTVRGGTAIAPVTLMITAGRELRSHGHAGPAQSAFDMAVGWQRGRPAEDQLSLGGLEFLGRTLYTMADYEQAANVYRDFLPAMLVAGLTQAQERGEELRFARPLPPAARDRFTQTMLSVRGALAAHANERPMADRIDRILSGLRDPYFDRYILAARARIAAAAGDDARAVELLQQAVAAGFFIADLHADPEFDELRGYAPYRELIGPEG